MSELSDIFALDPLGLSKQDINATIEHIRKQRHRYVAGNKSARTPEKRKSKATVKQDEALAIGKGIELDLGDL